MKKIIAGIERDVIITRKRSNKNTYIRVKEDMNLYVTTNYFVREKDILKLIDDNLLSIERMLRKEAKKQAADAQFTYLGKKYDIVYLNTKEVILGDDKLFLNRNYDINKWLRHQAQTIFQEHLDNMYQNFPLAIPYPSLTIRTMKTRWGVCNVRTKRVTLNLELIKKDLKYLDYVIAHELSHLIYPNHSKDFWNLVKRIIPNYKELRKEMRSYE